MNNIQFWIWLIVIVVTLIARARRKRPPTEKDGTAMPSRPPQEMEQSPKPMSFEELLREIQASKAPASKPAPAKTTDVLDYDDDIQEEEKSLERTEYRYPQPQQTSDIYEKAKQEAFFRPSLEETLKLEDTVVRFGQFKGYRHEQRRSLAADFAEEMRNPAGFRKAFIMSEILNRRF
jgi:hypothetical protein